MVDTAGGSTSCPALHHPHLYGPADYCRHRQPQGAQAQGQGLHVCLKFSYLCLSYVCLSHYPAVCTVAESYQADSVWPKCRITFLELMHSSLALLIM